MAATICSTRHGFGMKCTRAGSSRAGRTAPDVTTTPMWGQWRVIISARCTPSEWPGLGAVFQQKAERLVGVGPVDHGQPRVFQRHHRVGAQHGVVFDDQDGAALHGYLVGTRRLGCPRVGRIG